MLRFYLVLISCNLLFFKKKCILFRFCPGARSRDVPVPIKMILLHGRILRGFPFGIAIMPARSAAVDLYSASLPPRHRAPGARWCGGKENL